ncbi:hypothetical protein [Undibacterium sp. TJN19]|uniref:hypothetical protein n=1 Tax=Undibacterium sp. TJN19 TaxID=3413055 RepID=UPI003BF22B9E
MKQAETGGEFHAGVQHSWHACPDDMPVSVHFFECSLFLCLPYYLKAVTPRTGIFENKGNFNAAAHCYPLHFSHSHLTKESVS